MRTARTTTSPRRRVAFVALGGAAALAIVAGSAVSATAANTASGSTYSCRTTTGGTTLVDFSGGSGLINLSSPNGLVGVAVGSNGLQVGLLDCTTVVVVPTSGTAPTILVGTPTVPTAAATPAVTPSVPGLPTESPSVPATPVASPTPTPTPAPTSTTTTTTTSSSSSSTPTKLSTVAISHSATTVYPAAKGWTRSKVVFSIKGLTAVKGAVRITGKAVLRKGTEVVKTWRISSATSRITWNGKVGAKIKPGVYVLTVTAKGAGGVTKVSKSKVRVSAKHLVTRTVRVESTENVNSTTAALPAEVVRAMRLGTVTVRVRTVATVSGAAKLVFSANGRTRTVPLVNGTQTSEAFVVPSGFESVTVGHRWKKGVATLKSFRAIFSYKQLV